MIGTLKTNESMFQMVSFPQLGLKMDQVCWEVKVQEKLMGVRLKMTKMEYISS